MAGLGTAHSAGARVQPGPVLLQDFRAIAGGVRLATPAPWRRRGQGASRPGLLTRGSSAALPAAQPQLAGQDKGEADAPQSHHPNSVPVSVTAVDTLPPETSLGAAVHSLAAAVRVAAERYAAHPGGLVRLEVPVPRGSRPLWWLRGQRQPGSSNGDDDAAATLLHPRVYFSPRRSSAADTAGSAAAAASSGGGGSVAGAGAAWLWRGAPGQALGEADLKGMQRFLSGVSPRVRAFGGTRFNAEQAPAPEWREFGSFCFLIPRVEYSEGGSCNMLACTLAWDLSAGAADSAAGAGFPSLASAAADAIAALAALRPAAAPSAAHFSLERQGMSHTPDESGWATQMGATHSGLQPATASPSATDAAADPMAAARAILDGTAPDGTALPGFSLPSLRVSPQAARDEYRIRGQEGLDDLLQALDGGFQAVAAPAPGDGLTKVVLARRTDVSLRGLVDPLALLEALQERDPRSYQVALQMPSGATFLGSTPECLYTRTRAAVASEAVAGTRARGAGGDVEKDFWLAFDLLRSPKDHVEFTVVRDWVQAALAGVCRDVAVDVPKSVLKQGAVQHLYGRLSARLRRGASDAALLAALHPTPAVCGRPREAAMALLEGSEAFDRGFYAGPFGWVSQEASEFVVAIRSALLHPTKEQQAQQPAAAAAAAVGPSNTAVAGSPSEQLAARRGSHAGAGPGPRSEGRHQQRHRASATTKVSLYAGVGIVQGSDVASEWAELDLKVRQYERLLQTVPLLREVPNVNALWARLLVEELCRLGCNTFCVAPGSRCSPLTVAIAQHPRARVVPCIDERSLGFWALGYGRATGRPAVVVTSSGTAVANLLPAAVEASQSSVPLLLVTADRPAELRDSGANQTIDQVKIFGSFARWHADLTPPTDAVPARSILSAVDTAVHRARGPAAGPVHLNCQFREPLAPVEAAWERRCLQGLEQWEASGRPFTSHSSLLPAALPAPSGGGAALRVSDPAAAAALEVVGGARRGLIVVSELGHPDDVLAAVQLGQLLQWPVAADILSGLRAGARGGSGGTNSRDSGGGPQALQLLHHFDHLLLDRRHWAALRPDVVLQLGGHHTSKRTNQFLEWAALGSGSTSGSTPSSDGVGGDGEGGSGAAAVQWLLVERSPQRHDQSHLLTHRLQAPLPLFLAAAAQALPAAGRGLAQQRQRQYTRLLLYLDAEASLAVDAALARMTDLTEPHVARMLSQELPPGEGLFVGNSMPIRDLDMYATHARAGPEGSAKVQGVVAGAAVGAPVAANRGASGIDGVLSTAAGFADGLGRGCTLVVGDISFLHDINGLNLLRSGEARPPLTVVLVNNGGGGIFSFLPIADALPEDVFTPLWATPQQVDLEGMCRAQGVPHIKVHSGTGLRTALRAAWGLNRHSVVEVVTDRASNVERHRQVQAGVQRAVDHALALALGGPAGTLGGGLPLTQPFPAAPASPPGGGSEPTFELWVESARSEAFALDLARPLTAGPGDSQQQRRGFILRLALRRGDGGGAVAGEGEVAPLPGLHAESLEEAGEQLGLVCELLHGARVPLTLALLGGRVSTWLEQELGVGRGTLLPSVRCGLELALLSAIAEAKGVSLAQVLAGPAADLSAASVAVNGLVDGAGSAEEVAQEALALVGRRSDPLEDAVAVCAVRQAVGPGVVLRADANRRWTLEQAVQFGAAVAPAGLQYVEEPVGSCLDDAAEFYRRTGVPLALDESVDEGLIEPGRADEAGPGLAQGVVALVLKPSRLGGPERTLALADCAAARGVAAVVSSSFEGPLGIGQLAQLAAAADAAAGQRQHHGLGTLAWLAQGAASPELLGSNIQVTARTAQPISQPTNGTGAGSFPQRQRHRRVVTAQGTYDFALLEAGPSPESSCSGNGNGTAGGSASGNGNGSGSGSGSGSASQRPTVVFLHGFLGAAQDWAPLMAALSCGRRCLALDFPGHGASSVQPAASDEGSALSMEAIAEAVAALLDAEGAGAEPVVLVGYSMGARLALHLAARHPALFTKVAIVSGTPGIADRAQRAERAARDDAQALALRRGGLHAFLQTWYAQPMWDSLRCHPRFARLLAQRQAGDAAGLATVLSGMSPGRAPSLWAEIERCRESLPEITVLVGQKDSKFLLAGQQLCRRINGTREPAGGGELSSDDQAAIRAHFVALPACGHAVHIEQPAELLAALARFLLP